MSQPVQQSFKSRGPLTDPSAQFKTISLRNRIDKRLQMSVMNQADDMGWNRGGFWGLFPSSVGKAEISLHGTGLYR